MSVRRLVLPGTSDDAGPGEQRLVWRRLHCCSTADAPLQSPVSQRVDTSWSLVYWLGGVCTVQYCPHCLGPVLSPPPQPGRCSVRMGQRPASALFSPLLPFSLLLPLFLLPPSSPLPSSSFSPASRGGAVLPPDAFADAENSFDEYLDSNGMTWSKQSANGSDYDVVPFPSTITSRFAVVRLRDRVPSTGQYYSSHMMRLTNPESLDVVTATGQCRPGSTGESVGQIAAAHKCDYATNAGSISLSQHRRGTTRRQGESQDQGERQSRTLNGTPPSNASASPSSLPPPSVCGGAVVAEAVLVSEVDARAGSASAPSRASFGISRKRHWTFGYLNSASLLDPDQGGDYVAFVTGAGWLVRNRQDNLQASVDREHLPRGMVERRMARTVLAVGLENDMFILQVDGTGTGTSTGTGTVNRTGDTRTHAEAKGLTAAKEAKEAKEVARTDAELLEVASTLGMGVRQGMTAGMKGIFRSSATPPRTPRNNVGGAIGASSSSAHRRRGLANSTDPAQYFDSLPGLTLKELTEVLLKLGATQAIALGNAGESMAVWDGDVVSGSCFKRPDRCRAPVQTALCVRRDSSPAAQRRPLSKNLPGRADFMAFASHIQGAPAPSPSRLDAIASAMFATAASASSTLPPPPPTLPPQTLDDADAAATRAIADGKGGDGGNGGKGGNTAVATGLPGTTASTGSAQAQTLQTLLAQAPAQAPAPALLAAPALASPPTPAFAPSAPAPAPIAAPAVDWFSNRRLWEPTITKDTLDKLGTKTGKAASTLLRGVVGSGSAGSSELKLDSLFAGGGGASGEGGAGSGSGAGSSDDERAAVHRLVSAKVHADEVASGLVDAGGGGAGEEGAEGEAGAERRAFPAAGHSDEAAAEHRPPARTRASAAAVAAAGHSGDGMLSTSSMGQKADCTFFAVSC